MPHLHPVQPIDDAQFQPIDARRFFAACAVCSLGGLGVLAGLAQTLVWLWKPLV